MFINRKMGCRNKRNTAERTTDIPASIVKRVPMMRFISLRFSAPNACATSTCPPLANPKQTITAKLTIKLACATADKPAVPTYLPTTIISMVLYKTCSPLDAIKGKVNQMSCLGMLPFVKSFAIFFIL